MALFIKETFVNVDENVTVCF